MGCGWENHEETACCFRNQDRHTTKLRTARILGCSSCRLLLAECIVECSLIVRGSREPCTPAAGYKLVSNEPLKRFCYDQYPGPMAEAP